MPLTLTPVSQDDSANVVVPVGGVDKRKAVTVQAPVQSLLNTAKYALDRIALMLAGTLHFSALNCDGLLGALGGMLVQGDVKLNNVGNRLLTRGPVASLFGGGSNQLPFLHEHYVLTADIEVGRNRVITCASDTDAYAVKISGDPDPVTEATLQRGDWVIVMATSLVAGTVILQDPALSTLHTYTLPGAGILWVYNGSTFLRALG